VVYAAPVAVDRERTPSDKIRVVVVNSGNANACTGQRGLTDARAMAELAAEACGATEDQALVMSTGVIGEYLPMDKIAAGIQRGAAGLAGGEDAFLAAARGILTTDKSHKVAGGSLDLGGEAIQLAGLAKGAGMIGPRMATMLAVVLSDAVLTPADAQAALAAAVDDSFNCISVEGHMSTNDTVLLLASGQSGPQPLKGEALDAFRGELRRVCTDLAVQIPDDGEGSTHLVRIDVRGTQTRDDAFRIAKTVAESALVKTAISGGDPNWGRIVSAVGYSGIDFDPLQLSLALNGTELYRDGTPLSFDASLVSKSIRENRETRILLTVGRGEGAVCFWTSDLTVDYVSFNADYHT
jgi:glutamate N-acetyltransferase/amino-acid N-acetyltransferase